MNNSTDKWSLTILAAYSHKWSEGVAKEFREGVSSLLTDLEHRMRPEHPSLSLKPSYFTTGTRPSSQDDLQVSFAFAILDATDYDEDLGFLAGLMQGARIPYVFVCRGKPETVKQRMGLNVSRVIPYESTTDLFRPDSPLHQEVSQAVSQARVIEEFVYELWFPRDTSTIWVVCPQIHEPGEFADRSSPDYTYLDNLGDTDALLEIMVFLSRYYPKAIIEKFSPSDLPRGHTNNNLVVIGGPGSPGEISNGVCQEMMTSMGARVSYTADCERMLVALDGGQQVEFRAELRSDAADPNRSEEFNMRRDHGYFSRFPNPLNEGATVVMINGIHTAGVLGAAMVFADRRESLRNYHSVFNSVATPRSFECYFEVAVLNGTVKVPVILPENIHSLGLTKPDLPNALSEVELGKHSVSERSSVTIVFVAGDRGGAQRNQIQIPRELDSIQSALRACEHRDAISIATPILAATFQKLVEAYRHRPGILHFAGHGDERSLSFISDQGLLVSETPLVAGRLASILRNFPERVRLCVLNTCNSEAVAKELVATHATEAALGWSGKLSDAEAISFSGTFYGRLGDGLPLAQSVALASQSLGSNNTPVLFTDEGVDQNVIYVRRKN